MSSETESIRVFLVDPDDIDREGLKCLLSAECRIVVVGEASDSARALELATDDPPDIILIDSEALPPAEEQALDWLRRTPPEAKAVVLCRHDGEPAVTRLLDHGLMGVVLKRQAASVLRKAILKVNNGEPWLDRRTVGRLLERRPRSRAADVGGDGSDKGRTRIRSLTERERQIVRLVGDGCKNRQIAKNLSITEATVRNHLTSIFRKLRVTDRLALALLAYRYGLCEAPQTRE